MYGGESGGFTTFSTCTIAGQKSRLSPFPVALPGAVIPWKLALSAIYVNVAYYNSDSARLAKTS